MPYDDLEDHRRWGYMTARGRVLVYTDGACVGNGCDWAHAGIGVFWAKDHPSNVSERLRGDVQTNQRAELSAALRAVEDNPYPQCDLEIRTDSQYVLTCVNYYSRWRDQGWCTNSGKDVANLDLLQELESVLEDYYTDFNILFTHVRAHASDGYNRAADMLARAGAEKRYRY